MPSERESLPALLLDGAAEDGVVADNKPFKGFDGQPATLECGYAVNGRLLALRGTEGETLYGKLKDKAVTRPDGGWIVSWWLDKDDPLGTAKSDIGPAGSTSINAEAVQIDDAELLGTSDRMPGDPSPRHWSAGVTGGLVATVLGTSLSLRPDWIERDGDKVIFTEQSRGDSADSEAPRLTIRWNYAQRETQQQFVDNGLHLKTHTALLMDEVADGAWEAGSPLWIRTEDGFLRWHAEERHLPYRAAAESRTVDMTGWLPPLPVGGFARLLLDASGNKTLTINTHSKTAELSILDPALMIALPRTCCNGRDLSVPLLPPDDSAVTGTLCIVSQALASSGTLCTATLGLEAVGASTTRITLSANASSNSSTQYFAPAKNWVRPVESAANCAAGLTRARVLLPHPVKAEGFSLVLEQALTARGAGDFDSEAATSVALPAVGGEARAISGPLARFNIQGNELLARDHYGQEIWPLPRGEETSDEPAVLRSLYRRSSAQGSFAADALPPYTATRVVAIPIDTPALSRRPIETPNTRWHHMKGEPDPQLRFIPKDSNARRGWVDGSNFIGRISDKQGPIDYLEFDGATQHKRNWLRLSNDMLVSRPAAAPAVDATDPTSVAYCEGQASSLATAPLVTPLGKRDQPDERGSLSLFTLQETLPTVAGGSPVYELWLRTGPTAQDTVRIAFKLPEGLVVVNRLVIAVANPELTQTPEEKVAARKPKPLNDACGLVLTTLNRLYLELEREGDQFIVRRGMVGWNASGAFGLSADEAVGLEVTEMFERKGGKLSRTVEFNGALTVVRADTPIPEGPGLNNQTYCLTAYFWAAPWKYAADTADPTLRVIGYHGWTYQGKTRWFASMQDARVVDRRLDLSADLVLMLGKTEGASDSRGTDSPWQAIRRHLYAVKLDTPLGTDSQPSNKIAGFLTLRHGDTRQFKVNLDSKARHLQLIPDWRAAERDIVPLFADLPRPARPERSTWLRPKDGRNQRLNAGTEAGSPGKEIDVVLHAFNEDVPPGTISRLFACCLVGEIGREQGIPRWVAAPLQGGDSPPTKPRPAEPAATPAPSPVRMCRLWLFDGPPRMVDEWRNEWQGDPLDLRHPDKMARKTLARLGWTREAVLEQDPGTGPDAVTWAVVDSPLLNREASIGWFGWPLSAPGDTDQIAVWPQDMLPRTWPVPQFEAKAPRAFSIEVAFDDDRPLDATGTAPAAAFPIIVDLAQKDSPSQVSVPVKLRSAGLRAGVPHRLVDYDQRAIKTQMFPAAALLADDTKGELFRKQELHGSVRFSWDKRSVNVQHIAPSADSAATNSCLLEIPVEASLVRIVQSDDDLEIFNQDGVGQKVDRAVPYDAWTNAAGDKRLGIRMPAGKPFRTLVVEFCAGTPAEPLVREQRKYFDGGAERLAGLFNESGQLQAFGTEQVGFHLLGVDTSDAPATRLTWQRVAEWQGRLSGNATATATDWYVVTVDIEGRFIHYGQ